MSNTTGKANWAGSLLFTRSTILGWVLRGTMIFSIVLNMYLLGYPQSGSFKLPFATTAVNGSLETTDELTRILEETALPNKTVILSILNNAWIAPNSMFDLFLQSFQHGIDTQRFLKHLLVVSLDEEAHSHCVTVHPHCYHHKVENFNLTKAASYKSANYIEIVWRKIEFMRIVLDKGYNFLFTDGDIMWFRDPFPHLSNGPHFQLSCDKFFGNVTSMANLPNTGFMHVRSDIHTRLFFKIWYLLRYNYKGQKTQDVFNIMKESTLFKVIGLNVQFLDTKYFGGFCMRSKDISQVCTMHGNCCIGLAPKVHDLRLILNDWIKYRSSSSNMNISSPWKWSAPKKCRTRV